MPVYPAEPPLVDPAAPLKDANKLKEKQGAISTTEMHSLFKVGNVTDSLTVGMIDGMCSPIIICPCYDWSLQR